MTGDHRFGAEPTAQTAGRTVTFEAGGREFTLAASSRAVSAQRLDPGAAVLLRKAPLPGPRGGVYLDLGCGYGAITAVLAASSPATRVYAVDVDPLALELVARNAAALGLSDRIIPATPDRVPGDVVFDEIWSDPPLRIGKAELHELLLRWLPRLARHGTAWLVVDRHLGGDSLQGWLSSQGYQVERCASQKGYRVLSVAHAE